MFTLKLKSCPNQDQLGDYTFYFPVIKIGQKASNCHLPLLDPNIAKANLMVKDQPDGLLIWESSGGFYLSNSKKLSGKKLHRLGDSFGLGLCQFEIVQHVPNNKQIDIESRYHELTEKFPCMADLFWALKQEMLSIEKDRARKE